MSSDNKAEAFGAAGLAPRWYHGELGRGAAEAKLVGAPTGVFFVRDSTSSVGDFVMSVSESDKASHYIIQRRGPNVYRMGDRDFKDLAEIIQFYKSHLLDCTTLSVPLPLDGKLANIKLENGVIMEARALFNFNARDSEDLTFRKGDILNIIKQHEPQWWRAQSQKTLQIGCVPINYLERVGPGPPINPVKGSKKPLERSESVMMPSAKSGRAAPPVPREEPISIIMAPPPPIPEPEPEEVELPPAPPVHVRPKFIVARAKMDRVANAYDRTALSFKQGDVVHITKQSENGLWLGSLVGNPDKKGYFPFTLVELMDSAEYDEAITDLSAAFNAQLDEIYSS